MNETQRRDSVLNRLAAMGFDRSVLTHLSTVKLDNILAAHSTGHDTEDELTNILEGEQ